MVFIYKKIVKGKSLYYLRISKRVGAKVVSKDIAYLGDSLEGAKKKILNLPKYKGEIRKSFRKINLYIESEHYKDKIVETLANYKIGIQNIKATIGPTVTLYEIVPQAGIKISKIKNLEDDIALSLAALGIRIIAPIPGKGTIGIEVPNSKPEAVSIKSVIGRIMFSSSYNFSGFFMTLLAPARKALIAISSLLTPIVAITGIS